jgi:hypothetical protein
MLALAFPLVIPVPVIGAPPTFTGNVETNFSDTDPDVLIFTDPGISVPPIPDPELDPPYTPNGSGWDIKDLRLIYDSGTLYVGINSHYIVGDADNDGGEDTSHYDGGVDNLNLGGTECVSVYFDLDQDGTYDVIAGVPADGDFDDFSVNEYAVVPQYFGTPIAGHLGTVYWDPTLGTARGDLEFAITNFSTLPYQDGELGAFDVGVFMGSADDGAIGEDDLVGSTSPAIKIVKKTEGTNNNSPPGPYIKVDDTVTWTYIVTNPGSGNLTNIVVTDNAGTPGYIIDDFHPTYDSGDNGDNILQTTETWTYQASGPAKVGPHTNKATARGKFGGFTVSNMNPDNYTGVKAKIEISPPSDSNKVGEDHVLTACVYVDSGSGYALYTQPITINFTKTGGVGSLSALSVLTSTGCAQTILTSAVTGHSTVTAQSAFTVGGVGGADFNISTDGVDDNSGPAGKDWVAAVACIHIEKSTNGQDADSPTGPIITVGGTVLWEYVVTNCGDVALSNIIVNDSEAGVTPAYVSGDTSNVGFLDLTETWIYRASGTAKAGQYANTGYVTGTPPAGPDVSDDDPSHYLGKKVPTVGWETYPINKVRVLLPWIALLTAIIIGASLLVLRHRRAQS